MADRVFCAASAPGVERGMIKSLAVTGGGSVGECGVSIYRNYSEMKKGGSFLDHSVVTYFNKV